MLPDALPQRLEHRVEGLDAVRRRRLGERGERERRDRAHLLLLVLEPASMISTSWRRWGSTEQPSRIAICCTILMPVCRACHDLRLPQTARRKGASAGTPSADATTEKARAVVLRTYSSTLSMSGRIVAIIVARPAALARLEMISRPSTRA